MRAKGDARGLARVDAHREILSCCNSSIVKFIGYSASCTYRKAPFYIFYQQYHVHAPQMPKTPSKKSFPKQENNLKKHAP